MFMYGNQIKPDLDSHTSMLGMFEHLDTSELKDLLNNDERLADLINDSQQLKNLKMEREVLLASNKSYAEENLSFEPRLQTAKEKLASLHEEVLTVTEEFESEKSRLDLKMDQVSLESTLALLQTSAAEMEEESENLAEKFLEKGMEIEEYLETFLAKRTIAHLRKIKAEKMKELMNRPYAANHM